MIGTPIFKIKPRLTGFRLINLLSGILLILMGLILVGDIYFNYDFNLRDNGNFGYFTLGCFISFIGIFAILMLFLLSKKILVYENHFKIGKDLIKLNEVRGVKLTGLQPSSILFGEIEGMHIKLLNRKSYYLHDSLYKDLHHFKFFLDQKMKGAENSPSEKKVQQHIYFAFKPKLYHDSIVKSIYFGLFLGLFLLCTGLLLRYEQVFFSGVITIIMMFLFLYLRARFFSEIELTNSSLIVKRKLNRKKKKIIAIQNIREIASLYNRTREEEKGLLIVMNDFSTMRVYLPGLIEVDSKRMVHSLTQLQTPMRKGFKEEITYFA